ncbi:type III pantothenate kinase [Orrella daihaiensis]|uniref:Type III pantothenate kinase n=1 Tax=Orrella daihaiensis TaxID=2782176 RepID=A0ABY4ALS2_9BURK|nr:type III pantothenate kinase [Orrella daihaiensis]UOD50360.1 type III pantothenate kinase [Orrella daihaiensis]
MKLLIDIGNTRLKLATHQNNTTRFVTAVSIESVEKLRHELLAAIKSLDESASVCFAVSTANTEVNQAVQDTVAPVAMTWVTPSAAAAGVANAYPDPTQLGADRWVGMIGLTRHFALPHPPILLASFGTATTVDTLSPDNRFLGGLILPGVSLMHHALANGTANLPNTVGAITTFPTDTITAITSGIAAAQAGAVLRQMTLAQQTFGQRPVLCVTGGAWPAVADEFNRSPDAARMHHLPYVVLDGLAVLAG